MHISKIGLSNNIGRYVFFPILFLIRPIGPIGPIFPKFSGPICPHVVCAPAFFPLLFYAQSVIIPRMQIFNILFVDPVINLLVLLYKGFAYVNLPGALGWSIISITVAIRLAVNPLMRRQIEQSQMMQVVQPHLTKLQKKHKKDPKKLQQAQMELFKKHGINPGFGCIVLILQLPITYGLYMALSTLVASGSVQKSITHINTFLYNPSLALKTLDASFLGFNLSKAPNEWQALGWWYLSIPLITAALQFYQAYLSTKMMKPVQVEKAKITKKGKEPEKDNTAQAMQGAMQTQMLYFLPLMIGWFSYNFPVGVALYWNIFTIFGIVQYRSIKQPTV
ncbi:MAG: YidC/Oxa1 family membrane protein insertase [Candidatus Roizmanbacteria bacterium]|nr:YidC/Oxa1 family membrane protein insertase [Candidatus Roizmanbacteria bacterium]